MARRSKYYKMGFDDGYGAAFDTEEEGLEEALRKGSVGEIAGQVLEHWQQMADTIYYDEDVTPEQLGEWEEGFYDGFEEGVRIRMMNW
jgi:hypothetical protein